MRAFTASLSLVAIAVGIFGNNAAATVIWDVATGRVHAVNDGKPYRVTVDSGKGIAAVVTTEGVAYWIDLLTVNQHGLKPIPWTGLFGSGGPQKENIQASWNMDQGVYDANVGVFNGGGGFAGKTEFREMTLYEKQIVSEKTLPGFINLTK